MVHVVKEGETLNKIAKKYGTTPTAIKAANGSLIKDINIIKVGWVLTIPTGMVSDTKIKNALDECLNAIEKLPEYKALEKLL